MFEDMLEACRTLGWVRRSAMTNSGYGAATSGRSSGSEAISCILRLVWNSWAPSWAATGVLPSETVWANIWSLKRVLCSRALSNKMRLQRLRTEVVPVLVWGCATWHTGDDRGRHC